MSFNSFEFLFLFLLTFSIYYIPAFRKIQILIIITSSLIFYSWGNPQLLILLILSISVNAFISWQMAYGLKLKKIIWALIGITFNLSLLAFFKYASLFANLALQTFNLPENGISSFLLTIPLPLGISFYTFEGISLIVDVLRRQSERHETSFVDEKLNKHLINTSFFIAFFPHLIAGPILKAHDFFPQIQPKYFRQIPWKLVFRSLIIGYFLKRVIADNLKDYTFWIAYPFYQLLSTSTGIVLLFGYSIQIFADFAGYSLIAIGTAAVFGYNLPQNFNFPYISRSLSEFWQRWHISLSTWLKDYLYIPLGGNRKGRLRTYANLMIVMILGGLWHGAAWSYAVWGAFHGIGLVIERFLTTQLKDKFNPSISRWQQAIGEIVRMIGVFLFVTIGWLLFKLPDFGQALDFLKTMANNVNLSPNWMLIEPVIIFSLPVVVYHLIHVPSFKLWHEKLLYKSYFRLGTLGDDIILGGMLAIILLNSGSPNEFIYFQF